MALHPGEAQGEAGGVSGGLLDVAERDLHDELRANVHGPLVAGGLQSEERLGLPVQHGVSEALEGLAQHDGLAALGVAGAQLVLTPQAGAIGEWPEGLFEAEMRVAAFQNGYFTALCNRVGEEPAMTFAGESFVASPAGVVIARAAQGSEETLLCDIDFKEIGTSNAKRLFMPDRRPDIYADWIGDSDRA